MNAYHDPELDDVLQDDELRRLASVLESARMPEPPLDDAFRTSLRRQLMQQAWTMSSGGSSIWRRLFAPPGLAWAGAAAGLVLIASVVVFSELQAPGGFQQVVVQSQIDGNSGVALAQPILVSFNQPMNHQTTEAAVQITPATTVTFSWRENTLAVQPTSGNLAPNTQYQVTIGQSATTAAGQPLAAAHTITFVTQPPPSPVPVTPPRPTPTSTGLLGGERSLVALGGEQTAAVQWSADSSTVYYVDGAGALKDVPVKGGTPAVIAPDGVTSPAVSPDGNRIAYIRGGKIEVLTFATGATAELAPSPAPAIVGWSKAGLVWGGPSGVFGQGAAGQGIPLATLPATGVVAVLSFSPDGTHAVYRQDQSLFVIDLATGKSVQLGQAGSAFGGWAPDGTALLYVSGSRVLVADLQGVTQSTLPAGEASWSSQGAILLGTDTDLYQVRPDGTGSMKLSNGTYLDPVWAPDGASFVFFRGSAMFAASAPALPPEPGALDQAAGTVTSFMQARLAGQLDQAATYLDANGKQAYAAGGLDLQGNGDSRFTRYYVLTQELTATSPETARFVVRLVLTHGKIDVSDFEETLTVVRDASTKQFLIDQATASPQRALGKGAEVVGVELAADSLKVTFDSDLDPATISPGVSVVDAKGNVLPASATYANHTVTLSGLDLKPGAQYRLVVLTSVQDVHGQPVAAEYDLYVLGPLSQNPGNHQGATGNPSPSPSPSASPSAPASSSPAG